MIASFSLSLVMAALLQAPPSPVAASRPGPRLALNLPLPVSESDVAWQKWVLHASPEQSAHIERLLNDYRAQTENVIRERMPALDLLSADAAERTLSSPLSAQTVDAFERFWNSQLSLRKELDEREQGFLRALGAILSASQIERFYRVEWQRKRAKCGHFERAVHPARLDLSNLVFRLGGEDASELADGLLTQYESAVTPLFDDLDQTIASDQVALLRMAHEMMFFPDGTPVDASTEAGRQRNAEWTQRRQDKLAKTARLQRRIAEINAQFLPLLETSLPKDTFRIIRDLYRQTGFRSIFPDRYGVENSVDSAHSHKNLANHEAIGVLAQEYRRIVERINGQLMDRNILWMEHMAATQTAAGYEAYRREMRDLRDQRMRLHLSTVKRLIELSGVDIDPRLMDAMNAQVIDIEETLILQASDEFPGV